MTVPPTETGSTVIIALPFITRLQVVVVLVAKTVYVPPTAILPKFKAAPVPTIAAPTLLLAASFN
ncbi:hypothetical protein D3C87_2091970 [compost metagenome]